jgi:TonB family protein
MSKGKKGFQPIWLAYGAVTLFFLGAGIWMLKAILFSGDLKPDREIPITLFAPPPPPPPPPVEETPPPEVIEEIIDPVDQLTDEVEESIDEPPEDGPVSVDAEGEAGGSDWLQGKPGGQSLIGSGQGESSMLRKFAWYTRLLQDQVRKEMRRVLEKSGGWPEGDNKAKIRIELDASGRIVDFRLVDSSGNDRIDRALMEVLPVIQLSEPPPPDMPLAMYVRISAKG